MPEILLTGATGFIGRQLQQALQAAGHDLLALPGRQQLDLTRPESLQELPPARVVMHLAGAGNPTDFDRDPAASWQANLSATLNLLNACRQWQTEHFILASTYVYGPPDSLPVSEAHPVRPPHAYPRSKYLCEQLLQQFVADSGMRGTALRIFNVYGSGQTAHMLIPSIVQQLRQPTLTLRDPAPRRDFVHVSDVVRAFLLALQLPAEPVFEAINIASGQSVSVAELVQLLLDLSQSRSQVHYLQQVRRAEVSEVRADIGKAQRLLNWQPEVDFKAGLQALLAAEGLGGVVD